MAVQAVAAPEWVPGAEVDVVAAPETPRRDPARGAAASRGAGALVVLVSLLVVAAAAVGLGTPVAVAVAVPAAALLVHLRSTRLRLAAGDPGLQLLASMTAPIAVVALAVAAGALSPAALAAAAWTALAAVGAIRAAGWLLRARRHHRVLLVGDHADLVRTASAWHRNRRLAVVGTALAGPTGTEPDDLLARVDRLAADTVVVLSSPSVDADTVRRLGWSLEGTGVTLALRPALDSVGPHRLAARRYAGCTLLEVAPGRAPLPTRVLKAVADRAGALVLLLVLSPLLLVVAIAVRLESRGPVLFTQTRVGRDGEPFTLYKVRTMCPAAEEAKHELADLDEGNGVLFKVRRDPRVTRVGAVLRRCSLDELPQLLNVLKGEMSLVGPRPALPEEVAQYDDVARRRLVVRPGITGLWQVSGRSDLDWATAVALDVGYTDNITLGEDLRICARTFGAVTSGRGAY